MDNAVAMAAIGLAASSVAGLIWLAKFVAKTLGDDIKEHTLAAIQQTEASKDLQATVKKVGEQAEINAKNGEQLLTFMKSLNGKLAKATIQTVSEQIVENQTVRHTEDLPPHDKL